MSELLRMRAELAGEDGIAVSTDAVFSYPLHSHAYFEMLYYEPFDGEITVNDTTLVPRQAMVVLMTPIDLHRITVRDGREAHFIKLAFTEDCLGSYLAERLEGAVAVRDADAYPILCDLFTRAAAAENTEETVILMRALVLTLLQTGKRLPSPPHPRTHRAIARAVAIIQEEYVSDLTLVALAERLGLSPQHLSECFTQYMGVPFSAYLCETRLRHAAAALRSTDLTVTEICYACGYRNLSHFLRSFKRRYGITPREYGKQ